MVFHDLSKLLYVVLAGHSEGTLKIEVGSRESSTETVLVVGVILVTVIDVGMMCDHQPTRQQQRMMTTECQQVGWRYLQWL